MLLAFFKKCVCEKLRSKEELIIVNICEEFGLTVQTNVRNLISPLEIDIWIPELKLAIEINGVYWHSLSENEEYEKKALKKKHLLEQQGNNLLMFYDFEINTKLHIVTNIIVFVKPVFEAIILN